MTPPGRPGRVAVHPVGVDLPLPQIGILDEEVGNALSGRAQDLARLFRDPRPGRAVSELAAYARLAAAFSSGNLLLPDRAARKALRRPAEEVDGCDGYEQVVAEPEAFRAFERLLRTPPPGSGSSKGRSKLEGRATPGEGAGTRSTTVVLDTGAGQLKTSVAAGGEWSAEVRGGIRERWLAVCGGAGLSHVRVAEGPGRVGPAAGGRLAIDPPRRRVLVERTEVRLSRRDFDLLAVVARCTDRMFRRTELPEALWGLAPGRVGAGGKEAGR